jgi:hypothetical protein
VSLWTDRFLESLSTHIRSTLSVISPLQEVNGLVEQFDRMSVQAKIIFALKFNAENQTFLYPLFLDAMFCNCVAQTRLSSDITVLSQRHIVFVLKDNKTQISHWLSNTPDEK